MFEYIILTGLSLYQLCFVEEEAHESDNGPLRPSLSLAVPRSSKASGPAAQARSAWKWTLPPEWTSRASLTTCGGSMKP